jgi:F420-0:gamma-glutamyl ligase
LLRRLRRRGRLSPVVYSAHSRIHAPSNTGLPCALSHKEYALLRRIGTQAFGVRLPIISQGDDLAGIVADSLHNAIQTLSLSLRPTDVVGVTEALVAKAQGNFASIDDVAEDIRQKFPSGEVGLVFPICSRNRFVNILKGISRGVQKVHVLLQYPQDEVGNPVMRLEDVDRLFDTGKNVFSAAEFRKVLGVFDHPFTHIDYIALYERAGDNVDVHLSNDPRQILQLTKDVLVGEIHARERTKRRLIQAGARTVFTLSDVLSKPVRNSGFNPDYGILGSNLATTETLKLFPRDCDSFVANVRERILQQCGAAPEVLIYGDGAFKDPQAGIWELADPVVSPGYTEGLSGRPTEIKIKYVAENVFKGMSSEEKTAAVTEMIREKHKDKSKHIAGEGTTPRNYVDLLGSLCDLISGSGDKGTPVVLIQGYFDDYSSE